MHGIALWIGEELNELCQGDRRRPAGRSRSIKQADAESRCRLDRETRGCGDARERGDVAQYLTRASKGDRPTHPPVFIGL